MATANNEFFEALAALEKERGLPEDYLIEKIKAAIVIAVKKDYEVEDDNVVVDIDPELGAFRASLLRDIVEEVENPHTQVSLEDAQKVRKSYKVGQRMVTPAEDEGVRPHRRPDREARHPSGSARGRAQPAVQRDAVPRA